MFLNNKEIKIELRNISGKNRVLGICQVEAVQFRCRRGTCTNKWFSYVFQTRAIQLSPMCVIFVDVASSGGPPGRWKQNKALSEQG